MIRGRSIPDRRLGPPLRDELGVQACRSRTGRHLLTPAACKHHQRHLCTRHGEAVGRGCWSTQTVQGACRGCREQIFCESDHPPAQLKSHMRSSCYAPRNSCSCTGSPDRTFFQCGADPADGMLHLACQASESTLTVAAMLRHVKPGDWLNCCCSSSLDL